MTKLASILLMLLCCLSQGCATKGGWPCFSWQKNTDQKNEAAGKRYLQQQATNDTSAITPPLPDSAPVVQSMMAPAVSVPPPATNAVYIPLHWPEDWMNYSWQVFASSNLLDWKLVVTNVDMNAESIDVPSMGFEKGFYQLRSIKN